MKERKKIFASLLLLAFFVVIALGCKSSNSTYDRAVKGSIIGNGLGNGSDNGIGINDEPSETKDQLPETKKPDML